jgi:hypothetical protein
MLSSAIFIGIKIHCTWRLNMYNHIQNVLNNAKWKKSQLIITSDELGKYTGGIILDGEVHLLIPGEPDDNVDDMLSRVDGMCHLITEDD